MGTKYFSDEELMCPLTKDYKLAKHFGDYLDLFRSDVGRPVFLNSGARSNAHNQRIEGHPRSLHVYDDPHHPTHGCCAVDVRCMDSEERHQIVKAASGLGFSCGIASSFVHIDRRSDFTDYPPVIYLY